jgi:hypothetical protein
MADDDLGWQPPVSARDHPARRLAPCTFHAQLSSTPSANVALHLDEVAVMPAGRQFWLWRAVSNRALGASA